VRNVKPRQWERRPPGKSRPDPVLQAADLARELGVPAGSLQEIATRSNAPLSVSALTGFWIKRTDLPQWRNAVQRWRSDQLKPGANND
jgi:hypothetical protein